MSGGGDTKTEQVGAEEIEDEVMNALPSLDASRLEAIFELIGVQLEENVKGKKRELRNKLFGHLVALTEGEDDYNQFQAIYDHLNKKKYIVPKKDPVVPPVVRNEDGVNAGGSGQLEGTEAAAGVQVSETSVVVDVVPRNDVLNRSVPPPQGTIPRVDASSLSSSIYSNPFVRSRDYKFNGTIGGASGVSVTSIEYEIKSARDQSYSDCQIKAGVIKAIHPTHELRDYFETHPESTVEDMVEMFRSFFKERNSEKVYADLGKEYQKADESANKFVVRIMFMRKKVALLRQEEGCPMDEKMLTKRFYHVLFTGLRDDNVRAGLREKLEGRRDRPDNEIIRLLADIVAVETERKEKLFGKVEKDEVSVNMVKMKEAKTPVKKQRDI